MAEYIERIELIEEMKRNSLKMFNSYYKGYVEAIKDVADFKKADVQTVKHGRWIEVTPKHSRCSVCDTTCLIAVYPISKGANYCPNCGARMDGDTE